MRNLFLDPYSASDIDRFVAKVLADLGEPDPPVRLIDVRELLRLDKSYYSSTDDSAINEVVHKLTVAGQQVLARPSILRLSTSLGIFRTFGADQASLKWSKTIRPHIVLSSTCNGTSPEPFANGVTSSKSGAR